jgi:uncharacterized protein (TIGR00369 family)
MYERAPCNLVFHPVLTVRHGESEVRMAVTEALCHAAGAVHGSFYFKLLDDAAYFAANSLEPNVFVLTVSFHIHLIRPTSRGTLTGRGRVVRPGRTLMFAESVVVDDQGRDVARGSGVFARSELLLADVPAYAGSEERGAQG